LSEVKSITPPSIDVDQVEVTHMQSPNRFREFISGLLDGGEASFEMNFIPGSTSDDRLFELLNLPTGVSRRRAMRISYPNGVTWSFDGELTGYEPDVPFDDAMTATVTIKVTGSITSGTT
jgi:Lambda phage tail tube protein, TTP